MSPAAEVFDTAIPFWDISLRLLAASLAGAALGLERELKDRVAGLRTHMLVALAAALFTVITMELTLLVAEMGGQNRPDPLRIIEAVTAGVAFLGAGAIIQGRAGVKGLTTAAGLWLAGALGVAAGAGLYGVMLLATLLGVVIIAGLRVVEARAIHTKGRTPPPAETGEG